jgi:hypothetical protein
MDDIEAWGENFEYFQFLGGGPFYRALVNRRRRKEGKQPFPWFGDFEAVADEPAPGHKL